MFFPCLLQLLSFGLFHLHHWFLCVFYDTFLQTRKKLQCRRKQWESIKFECTRNERHWPCKGGKQCWNQTYLIYFLGFWLKIKFNYQMHECMWLSMLIYHSCYHRYDTKATMATMATMPNLVLPHTVGLNVRLKVLVLLLIITLICTTRFKHN